MTQLSSQISSHLPVQVFMAIGHAFSHAFLLLYATVVLALGDEFHSSYGELVTLSLGSFICYGVGALPAGWLGDRWSARGVYALMFFGMGAGAIFTGFANSQIWLFIGLSIIGLFGSIYHPVGIAIVVRYAKKRGTALGINGIFGGLGMASAALVAGVLTQSLGWRWAFYIPGMVSIAVGIAFLLIVPEIAKPGQRQNDHSAAEFSGWRAILPAFCLLVVASICSGMIYQSGSIAMPKFFVDRLDFIDGSLIAAGGFVTAIYAIGALGQYFGGRMADQFDLRRLFFLVFALEIPVIFAVAFTGNIPLLIFAQLMVIFSLGVQPVADSLLAHYVPEEWHARAYGIRFVGSLGVSAASVPLVAFIRDGTGGFTWLFGILGTVAIIAATVAFLLPRERAVAVMAEAAE